MYKKWDYGILNWEMMTHKKYGFVELIVNLISESLLYWYTKSDVMWSYIKV